MQEMLVIAVCLTLNAFFAAYEMAFVSVSRAELRGLAKAGNRHASALLKLRENPERVLSIIQVGITLVGAVAAAVGGVGAGESLEPYLIQKYELSEGVAELIAVTLVVIPITYLSVVVGELVPKSLALRNPVKMALAGTRPLLTADKILSPIISLFEGSTKFILTLFQPKPHHSGESDASVIEIGDLSPVHQRLVLNMAGIEKRRVGEFLLPWSQVAFVEKNATADEVAQTVIASGHTRLPVAEVGRIVGVLHSKEFIALKESGDLNWRSIVRPAIKILPSSSALGTLRLLQEKRSHMAIVIAPNNETLGIVTLEDIIEEVIGDVFDEDDDGRVRKLYAAKTKHRPQPKPRQL